MRLFYLLLPIVLLLSSCAQKDACTPPQLEPKSVETMSFIAGGKFLMGSKSGGAFGDHPLKAVYVKSFYLDKTEVTNEMYAKYMGEKKCATPPKYIADPLKGLPTMPVVDVNYADAKGFCEFYGKRLPTEAEWEYAARGGLEMKKFPWGDRESSTMMNYRDSGKNWSVAVKSYPPNQYGLYDMAGNVREWVADSYQRDFYRCPKKQTTLFGSNNDECRVNPFNEAKTLFKVNRGGSWHYTNGYPATVDFRSFDKASYKGDDLGFRCAVNTKDDNMIVKKLKEFNQKVMEESGLKAPKNDPDDILKEEMKHRFDRKMKRYNRIISHKVGNKVDAVERKVTH
ncbi:MAG: SUMF1/EgtB/PvdO family nonheme iron enzyme [Campylobacterales bacterium]|nr:SUMF1/EgtB/PvdO family nonheme iron enzyme [Campylobacterales bacterium]